MQYDPGALAAVVLDASRGLGSTNVYGEGPYFDPGSHRPGTLQEDAYNYVAAHPGTWLGAVDPTPPPGGGPAPATPTADPDNVIVSARAVQAMTRASFIAGAIAGLLTAGTVTAIVLLVRGRKHSNPRHNPRRRRARR